MSLIASARFKTVCSLFFLLFFALLTPLFALAQDAAQINSVTPSSAKIGQEIVIKGKGLNTTVMFFDENNSRTSVAGEINSGSTEVKAKVPSTLSRGKYIIKTGATSYQTSNGVSFTITEGAAPSVSDIDPKRAPVGSEVTITGTNLTSEISLENISGGQRFTVSADVDNSKNKATFEVPDIASGSYSVTVVSADGNANAPVNLEVGDSTASLINPRFPRIPTDGLIDLGGLISLIFSWSLGLLGLAVFFVIFISGVKIFTAGGNMSKVNEARDRIKDAAIGAVILLAAYLILYTINPDLVGGSIRLPPVPGPTQTTQP